MDCYSSRGIHRLVHVFSCRANGKRNTGKKKLNTSERKERVNAYKGKTKEQKKSLKAEFDAKSTNVVKAEVATSARCFNLVLTGSQSAWMKRWFQDAHATYNLVIKEHLDRRSMFQKQSVN